MRRIAQSNATRTLLHAFTSPGICTSGAWEFAKRLNLQFVHYAFYASIENKGSRWPREMVNKSLRHDSYTRIKESLFSFSATTVPVKYAIGLLFM